MICDFEAYRSSCIDHLESHINPPSADFLYEKIEQKRFEEAKEEIDKKLKQGLKDKFITNDEFKAMEAKNRNPGKFYQLFKVHKSHESPNLPPGRPIVSGCGSIAENISLFVDAHAKELVKELPSYIQDTPDLLRHLEELNKNQIPDGAFPVSIDVTGLYSNIPHQEGLNCLEEALNTREDKSIDGSRAVVV